MKNVRCHCNPNEKCEVQLKSHRKMYGTTEFPPAAPQPAEPNIQSMGLSSVGRPQPAEQNIQSMGLSSVGRTQPAEQNIPSLGLSTVPKIRKNIRQRGREPSEKVKLTTAQKPPQGASGARVVAAQLACTILPTTTNTILQSNLWRTTEIPMKFMAYN